MTLTIIECYTDCLNAILNKLQYFGNDINMSILGSTFD